MRYLLDYPLGRKLQEHLDFIVAQLTYEHDTGRESTLETLAHVIQTFPEVTTHTPPPPPPPAVLGLLSPRRRLLSSSQKLLLQYCSMFFAPLALVVANDDSPRCKKMASAVIKALLAKVDTTHRNTLFSLVNTWLNADKVRRCRCRRRRPHARTTRL